ncbi:porin family protein [Spirosoma areae]
MRSSLRLFLCGLWLACPALAQTDPPAGKASSPVKVSGGLNAYAGFYTASGIAGRNQPSPFGLSGSVTVALPGGISLPFSAVLGNQGSSFRQPFNQFGVSPTYKWATVHAGYRNVSFSPFTLAGHTFLGGGVELNPGNLRLGAVYGRFNKAISTNLAEPDILPAYQRMGYAVKIGYGKPGNYVDLVMLRARDDSSSIGQPASATAVTPTALQPAENLVVGATSRLLILKHITVELDAAVSAYTRDIRSTEVAGEGSSPIVRLFGRLFTPRLSTQLTQATQAAIGYRTKNAGIKLQYKRIDPNFQTMGAYYFQSDIESYAIAPNLTLLEGKLRLSGSYGLQYDNLAQNKNSRTGRRIGSLVVSYNPATKFGLDVQFSNYGISQQAGVRPLIDTLRLAQNNLSATVNTRYTLQKEDVLQVFTLTTTYQKLSDLNASTASQTENNNINLNLGYFYQQTTTGWGFNGMASYTQTQLPVVVGDSNRTVRFYGPTLGVTQSFFEKKLTASVNASYLFNQQLGVLGKVLSISANGGYQVAKRQTLNLSLNYLNSNTGIQEQTFNELRGNLGYGISF